MTSLFAQFYTRLTAGLVIVILVLVSGSFLLIQSRFEQYVINHATPVASLVIEGWKSRPEGAQDNWLDLVSNLTHSQWHVESLQHVDQKLDLEVVKSSWRSEQALIRVPLDTERVLTVWINNWGDWQRGYGWLVLNALSMQPALERQAYLNELKSQNLWSIDRVSRLSDNLSPLALRQLSSGQAFRKPSPDNTADTIYMPAGASQAIRIGPIPRFQFLGVYQWLLVTIFTLILMAALLTAIIRPIQKRIMAIRKGVDLIWDNHSDIHLPSQYNDDLGIMAKHIEKMAERLSLQIEKNRQLNLAVSHDLKTPLARLKFLVAMAEDNPKTEFFDKMRNDINVLTDLTNELLLFHQLQVNQGMTSEVIEVKKIIIQVTEEYPKTTKLKLEIPDDLPDLPMSEPHLKRLMRNLIDNAIQYGKGQVIIWACQQDRFIQIGVSDDGPGLSQSQFEQLKQPFSRGETSRNLNRNNHGLGLSLVDAIVRHYGGELTLKDSSLGGADMVVCLSLQN